MTVPFERRTLVVLACLVASMTLVSGLLLALDPAPLAPINAQVLAAMRQRPRGAEALLSTDLPIDPYRWQAIVVHHTGPIGDLSAEQIAQDGLAGRTFHVIIRTDDEGAEEGILIGRRWRLQLEAAHAISAQAAAWLDRHAISICWVGDGDKASPDPQQMARLIEAITTLQQRLRIAADRVVFPAHFGAGTSPGLLFPAASFRQQLVSLGE